MPGSEHQKEEAIIKRKWDLPREAEVEFHEMDRDKPCKHYFVRKTGQWIECKKCHWGLQLSAYDELVNGHLYSNGRKII